MSGEGRRSLRLHRPRCADAFTFVAVPIGLPRDAQEDVSLSDARHEGATRPTTRPPRLGR